MSSVSAKAIWYGMLETLRANSVLLRDDGLPEGSEGRVYLYNVDRDQIVEYVEAIVSTKLRELSQEEIQALGKGIEKQYKAARKAFLAEFKSRQNVLNLKSEAPAKPVAAVEDVDDTAQDMDDVEIDVEADEDVDWEEEDEEKSA
ncbi:MAG TPA: hypothetical protein DD979_02965 [Gammaproteobacteria bacterium]|nr:hypothetical protein [Gammaproteobacteria bacterium]